MPAARNVLLIVVDQWRGLMLPKLGADYLKLPNIDLLCAEGVTFRNHFTQCVPCGPARASLMTGHVPDESSRGAEHRFRSTRASPISRTNCAAAATIPRWSATRRRRPIRARPPPTIRASSCWATSWMVSIRSAPSRIATPISAGWRVRASSCRTRATTSGARKALAGRRDGPARGDPEGIVGHRVVHRTRHHLSAGPRRPAMVPASGLLPAASAVHRVRALQCDGLT